MKIQQTLLLLSAQSRVTDQIQRHRQRVVGLDVEQCQNGVVVTENRSISSGRQLLRIVDNFLRDVVSLVILQSLK